MQYDLFLAYAAVLNRVQEGDPNNSFWKLFRN